MTALENKDVRRIWIMGDVHFGVRSASMEWFDITKSYFEDYFIPLLQEHYQPGDILLQVGDLFENRQIVNLKLNSYVIELFERLSQIIPIHILVGNHDIYFKKTNDVTSLDSIRNIKNVTVYKEPELIKFGQTNCLIMPWRYDHVAEEETLKQFPDAEFVFCHSEMQGVMLNRKVMQNEGTKVNKFKNYKRVYSGHIHYSQTIKNVVMVGNAYQMTRSDIDNPKGLYLLDLDTGEHEFFENNVSPKFRKLHIAKLMDMTLGQFKELITNNFIDLYIPSDVMIKNDISYLINLVQDLPRRIEPNIYDESTYIDIDSVTEEIQNGYKNFDILSLCHKWIESMGVEEGLKQQMKEKIQSLYTSTVSGFDPDL